MKKKMFLIPALAVVMSLVACGEAPTPPGPQPKLTYTVTWDLDNGTAPIKETYKKGDMPSYKHEVEYKTIDGDESKGYFFSNWDKPIEKVTSDITYKAIYDDEPTKVMTTVVLYSLMKSNRDHFEFTYTGKLRNVDWGDGSSLDQATTHTYPDVDKQTYYIKIYGDISSISFANEDGVLGKTNIAISTVLLSETIKEVPSYAFNKLAYMDTALLSKNIKTIGENAFKDDRSYCLIYAQTGLSMEGEGWESDWNPNDYRVVKNINGIGITPNPDPETTNQNFGYILQQDGDSEYLGISSFFGDTSIENITIPQQLLGRNVQAIVYNPFLKCNNLKTVTIQEGLTYIGIEAFSYRQSITTVNIPNSLIEIGRKAFEVCTKLVSVSFPVTGIPSLTTIMPDAFHQCLLLESFTMPSSVNYIGASAFRLCDKLTSVLNFQNCQITQINDYTFANSGLTSIALPETLANGSIGESAFANCDNIQVDATRFTAENIPTCAASAFDYAANATVVASDTFTSSEEAKAAFVAKGWPESITYQLETPDF